MESASVFLTGTGRAPVLRDWRVPVDPATRLRHVLPLGRIIVKQTKVLGAVFAMALMGSTVAAMAGMVADAKGMTLYTFDKDAGGASVCYDACATKWPPYLGKADAKLTEGWTLVDRKDGAKQWAYDGKPVYYFEGDKAKGDMKGDAIGGVWHVIKE